MELPEAARKLPRLLVAAQGPASKYAACVGQQWALAEVCPPAMAVQSCPSLVQICAKTFECSGSEVTRAKPVSRGRAGPGSVGA